MATKASNFRAEDLVLIESTAFRDQKPGDKRAFIDEFLIIETFIEFGVTEVSVHQSGTEGIVTAKFIITEKVAIDDEQDDGPVRENVISCSYRVHLHRDFTEETKFDVADLDPDEFVNVALTFSYPYFRQSLKMLSREVFVNEHEMPATWTTTRERLDSSSVESQPTD